MGCDRATIKETHKIREILRDEKSGVTSTDNYNLVKGQYNEKMANYYPKGRGITSQFRAPNMARYAN